MFIYYSPGTGYDQSFFSHFSTWQFSVSLKLIEHLFGFLCLGSNTELLDVNRAPKFLEEPVSTIALKGRPVTLFCNVEGKPPPRIEWSRNGKPVLLNSRRLILPKGDLVIREVINRRGNKPDVGVYQCQATNKVGTTVSRKVKLSVAGESLS